VHSAPLAVWLDLYFLNLTCDLLNCLFVVVSGCWWFSSSSQGIPEGRVWADTRARGRLYLRWGALFYYIFSWSPCVVLLVRPVCSIANYLKKPSFLLGPDRIRSSRQPLLGFWNSRCCSRYWYVLNRVIIALWNDFFLFHLELPNENVWAQYYLLAAACKSKLS